MKIIGGVVLDERASPAKRGVAAKEFKKGPAGGGLPVMLAGVECMSEGHSFHLCNNVILTKAWGVEVTGVEVRDFGEAENAGKPSALAALGFCR